MSSKVYFRWLALFVAMLGIAQIGWIVYFSIPKRSQRRTEIRRLAFPPLSSPTFKYRYRVEGERASDSRWREVEIPEKTGRKLLTLLRGSKSLSVATQEFLRKHPGSMVTPAIPPDSVGRLSAYEDGSENPSLSIEFLGYYEVMVSGPGRKADTFVISTERRREIMDVTAEIQWGPIPKEEP